MRWNEMITAAKDILVGAAAAVTALVALIGFFSWRRELAGKAEFEAAKNLMRATYKLRDQIRACRYSIGLPSEFPDSESPVPDSGTRITDRWSHFYERRKAEVITALQEFDMSAYEAEVAWGSEIGNKANALRGCVHTLFNAIDLFVDNQRDSGLTFKGDPELAQRIHATVFAIRDNESNEFTREVNEAIRAIELFIRPILKPSFGMSSGRLLSKITHKNRQ